ncbi:hypothetical protein HUU40_19095 [candidate division KSB1 bacterium]|nr:hypothetical protein [candidate division KSB1 bacterium]
MSRVESNTRIDSGQKVTVVDEIQDVGYDANVLRIMIAGTSSVTHLCDGVKEILRSLVPWQKLSCRPRREIEIFYWPDLKPSAGSPQEMCNRYADKCHIFIGIVGTSLGDPIDYHGSGFEQEVELVVKRWKETLKPEIWLFRKKDSSVKRQENKDQIRSVEIFFKKYSREVCFKEFGNPGKKLYPLIIDMIREYLWGDSGGSTLRGANCDAKFLA